MKYFNVLDNEIRAGVLIINDVATRGSSFYQDKIDAYVADIEAIINAADDEDRELTEEETQNCEEMKSKINAWKKQLELRNLVSTPSNSRGRKVKNADTKDKEGKTLVEPTLKPANSGTFGFKSMGEFANCVAMAKRENPDAMQRFQNAASTYNTELNGPDGGFLVPSEFGTAIWNKVRGEDSLLSRCTEYVTSTNNLVIPKNEDTPWGSSGTQAYWEGEGSQLTASKPNFQTESLRLNKLTALVNVSEELLDDAPALASWIMGNTPQVMTSEVNDAIINGNGVGKPLGILQAASLLTLTKETSQDAATVVFQNIINMYARLYAPLRGDAVWLINQDIEPQLDQLAFNQVGENLSGSQPLYMPVAGLQESPNARLKSRPVLPFQSCPTLGTSGDIVLVDLSQYAVLTKAGGIDTATSMHLYFDQQLMSFRFVFRITGKPMWNSTIAPRNGSNTLGWAVVMEDRD